MKKRNLLHVITLLILAFFITGCGSGSGKKYKVGISGSTSKQWEYVKKEAGEYPVLLLDDVMSELDSERRKQILNFIDGRVQTFITVNDKNLIPELACNRYFCVSEGSICEG